MGPNELGSLLAAFGKQEGIKAHQRYLELYERRHAELLPPPDERILGLIKELKQKGVRVILISGRDKETTDISLRFFHLDGLFEKMYLGSVKGVNKPESILKAQEDFHIQPQDMIYIGDTCSDIKSCKAAGIDIISVNYYKTEDLAKLKEGNPGQVLTDIGELKPFLFAKLGIKD